MSFLPEHLQSLGNDSRLPQLGWIDDTGIWVWIPVWLYETRTEDVTKTENNNRSFEGLVPHTWMPEVFQRVSAGSIPRRSTAWNHFPGEWFSEPGCALNRCSSECCQLDPSCRETASQVFWNLQKHGLQVGAGRTAYIEGKNTSFHRLIGYCVYSCSPCENYLLRLDL